MQYSSTFNRKLGNCKIVAYGIVKRAPRLDLDRHSVPAPTVPEPSSTSKIKLPSKVVGKNK